MSVFAIIREMFERDDRCREKVEAMQAAVDAFRKFYYFYWVPWQYSTARRLHRELVTACREVSQCIQYGGPSRQQREWMTTELHRAELWTDANWDWHDRFGRWPKVNQNDRAHRRRIKKWLKER